MLVLMIDDEEKREETMMMMTFYDIMSRVVGDLGATNPPKFSQKI
jgi:hypothetical protein